MLFIYFFLCLMIFIYKERRMILTILLFVLKAIEENPNDSSLGEEIRVLHESIENTLTVNFDEVLDHINNLIILIPNDQELGSKIRSIHYPLNLYINAKQNSGRDSHEEHNI